MTQSGRRTRRARSASQDLYISRVPSIFRALLTPPTTPEPRGGKEGERGAEESLLTLQREEGQEEAQHPDAVQPVGPHVSAALDAPSRAPAVAPSAGALSWKTRRSFPSVSLWALRAPATRTDQAPAARRPDPEQSRSPLQKLEPRAGEDAQACAWCKHSEPPFPSSSPALLLPTLLSLTPLQLQLNATVLKQAAFYRTANRAERALLLPSSAHIPASPQICVYLCVRGPSSCCQFPFALSKHR